MNSPHAVRNDIIVAVFFLATACYLVFDFVISPAHNREPVIFAASISACGFLFILFTHPFWPRRTLVVGLEFFMTGVTVSLFVKTLGWLVPELEMLTPLTFWVLLSVCFTMMTYSLYVKSRQRLSEPTEKADEGDGRTSGDGVPARLGNGRTEEHVHA